MANDHEDKEWQKKQIPLKDIVLSNSWAVQAILQYLENNYPGAKDEIWAHYQHMKSMADQAKNDLQTPQEDEDYYFDEEQTEDWIEEIDTDDPSASIN